MMDIWGTIELDIPDHGGSKTFTQSSVRAAPGASQGVYSWGW